MVETKWSDDSFLDVLQSQGDSLADRTVARLEAEHGVEEVNQIFKTMYASESPIPEGAPAAFREFVAATGELPSDIDPERLERGGKVFLEHAFSAAVVLLASSLPAGYSAPRLSRILTISGDLHKYPYKRLMGVLQLLVNISVPRSFRPQGEAVIMAQKMRLLHAGIRTVVPKYRPDFAEEYGVAVSHEDMLATIMGFSWLVIDGLRVLDVRLSQQEEEDYYYLWRIFAQMVGIHPDGEPESGEYVPQSVADAAAFYESYARRHYVGASENRDGVCLSKDNLRMLEDLIPGPLKLLGFKKLPRVLMHELLGDEGMARVGLRPVIGHRLTKSSFEWALHLVQGSMDDAPSHLGERLGRLVFQEMINKSRGEVTFLVPDSLAAMRKLA